MPHISLPAGEFGIRGALAFRPETAAPLMQLAETLLRGPNSLSVGDRELIATVVSYANECDFCLGTHRAAAAHSLEGSYTLVDAVTSEYRTAAISPKLKALLAIAEKVSRGGKMVDKADIERARSLSATDVEIHDTVLIAAAFCMFNRYVDGLAAPAPPDAAIYNFMGERLAKFGYSGAPPAQSSVNAA